MTLTKFEAKLNLPFGVPAPEVYDLLLGQRPADDFIISRNRDGAVVSVYGDMKWNVSAWHSEGRLSILNFDFWRAGALTPPRDQISKDARWLIFSLIWLGEECPISITSLQGFLSLIRALALNAENIACSLGELLSDEKRLRAFVDSQGSSPWRGVTKLCSLLSRLVRIGETQLGFTIVGDKFRKVLHVQSIQAKAQDKQTPPIPTKIYSSILSSLMGELDEWERVAPECLKLLQDCGKDSYYGRRGTAQRIRANSSGLVQAKTSPQWPDVASPRVRSYLKRKGVSDSISGLASMVVEVQAVTKLIIQAFSGMRDNEALSLPYDCSYTIATGGRTHCLIQGCTTKLSKGPKAVRWVTNKEGHRAIDLAQQIATTIYAVYGTTAVAKRKARTMINSRPLFVSLAYTSLGAARRRPLAGEHFFPVDLSLCKFDRLLSRLQPIIKDEHLVELEQIDEHRAWRSEEKFQLGRPWSLTTHQFRRSLALYAQRSGLVTLPSLRQQLQHITDEMSRYYSRGSQYAKDIFDDGTADPGHFSLDWQSATVESETISYVINVLLTNDSLFGGHAAFVSQRLRGPDRIVTSSTRAETVRMFKKGQLHYRETLIGGCTRSDECESPAVDWMNLDCISNNCGNMVGNLSRLESVVNEQARLVGTLLPTSLLYRTENANLSVLVRALEKARQGIEVSK